MKFTKSGFIRAEDGTWLNKLFIKQLVTCVHRANEFHISAYVDGDWINVAKFLSRDDAQDCLDGLMESEDYD